MKPSGLHRRWSGAARRRALLVCGLLVLLAPLAVSTSPSVLADSPDPTATSPSGGLYVPSPTIDVSVHQPVCDGNVPYLEYKVDVTGTSHNTVTLTWVNPSGSNVVHSGLPLQGRVLWPGAAVDAQGNPTDWPGWRHVNGEWVQGDEFDWVRQPTQVLFEVNPRETVTVTYPPSSPNCSANPPGAHNPTMKVRTLTPVCADGAAYLDYAIEVTGTPARTATLTWHNPTGGADVVQSGQPLAGRVLWPGAYPQRDVDLPNDKGWRLVNNMWVNVGQYPWATGTISLTFAVNSQHTVSVTYPQAGACQLAAPPIPTDPAPSDPGTSAQPTTDQAQPPGDRLARTGSEIAPVVAIAGGLALIGVIFLLLRRQRGQSAK